MGYTNEVDFVNKLGERHYWDHSYTEVMRRVGSLSYDAQTAENVQKIVDSVNREAKARGLELFEDPDVV